jgi:hypothetical protein
MSAEQVVDRRAEEACSTPLVFPLKRTTLADGDIGLKVSADAEREIALLEAARLEAEYAKPLTASMIEELTEYVTNIVAFKRWLAADTVCGQQLTEREALSEAQALAEWTSPAIRASLDEMHMTFRAWLGQTYDVGILDVALGCRLAHLCRKGERPPWLLIVGGSAAAKTETLRALEKSTGSVVIGTILSQASLLGGMGKKDQDKDATGGLLKLPGMANSFWLLFDVTSVLALGQDARSGVLDGFRWMYDGRWPRSTGGGGGRSAYWEGRIGLVGGVTTEIDRAHDANQKLGSRWMLIRQNETDERREDAGRHAVRKANQGSDPQMQEELNAAVWKHLASCDENVNVVLTEDEEERIRRLGDLTTRVRSVVNYDHSGANVIDRHALEDPTRFPIGLVMIFQGLLLLGLRRGEAMQLVARIAAESVPPFRRRVLECVATAGVSTVKEVRKRLGAATDFGVRRELNALIELGMLTVDTEHAYSQYGLAKGRFVEWLEYGAQPCSAPAENRP